LIDKTQRKLLMGEAKIDTGKGAIFNMTPSPGGTSCLENAEIDMRAIAKYLGAAIDEKALQEELLSTWAQLLTKKHCRRSCWVRIGNTVLRTSPAACWMPRAGRWDASGDCSGN
jgi:hypothetical protein